MKLTSRAWERLGAEDPYYAVLTEPKYHGTLGPAALGAFFASGEADVAMLLDAVHDAGGAERFETALDFGCGVGRLTIPLARRVTQVIGVDVAASMLDLARKHASASDVSNATFLDIDRMLAEIAPSSVDLLTSYIVFQHIPVRKGEALLEHLLTLLRPGGAFALHFTFRRSGGRFKRMLRRLRASLPLLHTLIQLVKRERRLPYMEMNAYDERRLAAIFAKHGCSPTVRRETSHGEIDGATLAGTNVR